MNGELPLGFVGSYPPRRCGIATFTRDLAEATASARPGSHPMTVAVTDPGGQYEYARDVKYEIRQGVKGDYARAAEFVNYSDVRLVYIQHEYGIFGGDDGVYILDFLSALQVPAIVTLHTVLKHPSDSQRSIVKTMANQCPRLVVMSRVARDLLESSYGIGKDKVQILPHGIPQMQPRDQQQLKSRFGISGRRMLLTFGLLSPNKGIETAIRALGAVIAEFPDLVYFVIGATHPTILRRHGEAYRTMLEREAERLGVREHIVFRDQFVSTDELCSYLQAADIFLSPYLNEAQVTSGALSYAMGAGAAVVSTPYWHALELLSEGRGSLFPFGDSKALCEVLLRLLGSRGELERTRSAAFDFTRSMVWSRVGRGYVDLALETIKQAPRVQPLAKALRSSSLPDLRLDHLLRLTDDTGIIQHATYSVPARRTGYCVDDNSRALIVALRVDRMSSSVETRKLINTYLSFIESAQKSDGLFSNFMTYQRVFEAGPSSADCDGRAVWALGTTVELAADDGCRLLAREMFERALEGATRLNLRGTASVMLGLASFLRAEPDALPIRTLLAGLAENLVERYQNHATDDWHWFEPMLTYDNATLPLALFQAYLVTGERSSLRVGRESLEFLENICFTDEQLSLVGNSAWHARGSPKSESDEQAIDAAAFVLAFRGAYLATGERHYLRRMTQSFSWFLGANRLGLPLYDFTTAGCRDGLGRLQANQNQGAESTICFLLSLLSMLEVAGEAENMPSS